MAAHLSITSLSAWAAGHSIAWALLERPEEIRSDSMASHTCPLHGDNGKDSVHARIIISPVLGMKDLMTGIGQARRLDTFIVVTVKLRETCESRGASWGVEPVVALLSLFATRIKRGFTSTA